MSREPPTGMSVQQDGTPAPPDEMAAWVVQRPGPLATTPLRLMKRPVPSPAWIFHGGGGFVLLIIVSLF